MDSIDFSALFAGAVGEVPGVWWGQGAGEPMSLVDSLLDTVADPDSGVNAVRAFSGLSLNPRLSRDLPDGLEMVSYGALGELRKVAAAGRLEIIPAHYSALPRLFAQGRLPADVGLLQVSPPDRNGRVSLGIGVDYCGDALQHTRTLVAEINHAMPFIEDGPTLSLSDFAATVEVDRPLATMPLRAPDEVDQAIAGHVAGLIEDGATLQVGVGTLPNAVLQALSGHRDLGFHSGMITDGVLDLIDSGAVTGARKEIDPGAVVTGSALGSANLYRRLGEPAGQACQVSFRPASYTHDPRVLSRLGGLVAINSALEVDLAGQVGSERVAGRYLGAIGGQADFSRAASLTGARSIIALRSTSRGASTIRPVLDGGLVTTVRADVDVVVTEHGAAVLTGLTERARALALINIAAEEHRDELARAVHNQNIQEVPA
ncbi:acetyl-CoA hydrolase/transferase C-terminal domain-containing protein [Arthrobacter rhombi]|uniref:acetyl-CoA hydrolase/transferase family protein n=1 Tax=Arthrobacter rhombi TaxID=71253 RepID=UPI0031D1ADE6